MVGIEVSCSDERFTCIAHKFDEVVAVVGVVHVLRCQLVHDR